MSQILKANGIVLKRQDHGETSRIITLYTEEFGKIKGIVKGAKSGKSKAGGVLDLLNLVSVVFYNKENRDLQMITQAELVNFYTKLKNSLDLIAYASAVLELVEKLTPDHEQNGRLYKGTTRILDLFEAGSENPEFQFAKYFLFFTGETGYKLPLDNCASCGKPLSGEKYLYLNYNHGFYCGDCGKNHSYFEKISKELFNLITCLNIKNCDTVFNPGQIKAVIKILEKYMMFHNPDFTGLRTLRLF